MGANMSEVVFFPPFFANSFTYLVLFLIVLLLIATDPLPRAPPFLDPPLLLPPPPDLDILNDKIYWQEILKGRRSRERARNRSFGRDGIEFEVTRERPRG